MWAYHPLLLQNPTLGWGILTARTISCEISAATSYHGRGSVLLEDFRGKDELWPIGNEERA